MSRELHTPKLPVTAPATLRQSLLSSMDNCPYAGYLYVAHDGGAPSHPMHRGSAFHATVARCIETLTLTGNTTIAPDDAKAVMLEVLDENPQWIVPAGQMDGLRVMVFRWAMAFVLPPGARAETPFYMRVDEETVTGTIDLLWTKGDTAYVRDWKAGWHLYPQTDVSGTDGGTGVARGAKAAQLITYALLMADGASDLMRLPAGINKFDLAFCFPMWSDEAGDGIAERGVVVTRPELIEHREWMRGLVARTVRAFAENRYAAVPGSHCSRCPASWLCPLPAKVRGGSPFERKPQDVAEDYLFLKQGADDLRAELKAYAQEYGAIPVGKDLELGFKQTASGGTRFDMRKKDAA